MVRVVGLEPTRLAAQEPKSCVSTNSTIPACTVNYTTPRRRGQGVRSKSRRNVFYA